MAAPLRLVPALLLSPLAAQAPAPSAPLPAAAEVLAKLEARIGDAAARKKLRTLVMRGTIEGVDVSGSTSCPPIQGKVEEFWLGPERARAFCDFGGAVKMDQGTAGAFSWTNFPSCGGIMVCEGEEQGPLARQLAIARREPWTAIYASAETLGIEEIEGRKHYKLAMKPAAGEAETWFVDAETFDLGAFDTTVPDAVNGILELRFVLGDHRVVQGIRFPHAKTLRVGAVAMKHRYDSIEPNAEVKPEQVAPTPDVLEAVKDPSKRLRPPPADPNVCKVEELAAQPVLSIRVTIPAAQISKSLAVLFPEVMGSIAKAGTEIWGPPFTRYHSNDGKTIDLEAGIPVKEKVEGTGRVKASELPAGKAVVTCHVGPYEALPTSHARLEAWLKAQSLESRGGFWETYLTDPGIEPDPSKWRTLLVWPVK